MSINIMHIIYHPLNIQGGDLIASRLYDVHTGSTKDPEYSSLNLKDTKFKEKRVAKCSRRCCVGRIGSKIPKHPCLPIAQIASLPARNAFNEKMITVLDTTQAFIQIIKESESEELRTVNCPFTLLVSPVRNHPSEVNSFAVASGLPQYSLEMFLCFCLLCLFVFYVPCSLKAC